MILVVLAGYRGVSASFSQSTFPLSASMMIALFADTSNAEAPAAGAVAARISRFRIVVISTGLRDHTAVVGDAQPKPRNKYGLIVE